MKIFIVFNGALQIKGVFATEELAIESAKIMKAKHKVKRPTYYITQFDVIDSLKPIKYGRLEGRLHLHTL